MMTPRDELIEKMVSAVKKSVQHSSFWSDADMREIMKTSLSAIEAAGCTIMQNEDVPTEVNKPVIDGPIKNHQKLVDGYENYRLAKLAEDAKGYDWISWSGGENPAPGKIVLISDPSNFGSPRKLKSEDVYWGEETLIRKYKVMGDA